MVFFKKIERAPDDPIFGLNTAFARDPRESKVNLGVGSYKTAELKPLILSSVKQAERILIEEEKNKEYLPLDGEQKFIKKARELVFGTTSAALAEERIYGAQGIGGTGAIRIGAQFLSTFISKRVFLSDPTWDNHARIFKYAGFQIATYPYYDKKKHDFDFDGMCAAIREMPRRSVILLQGCCHNPTGFDPSFEQWQELCALIKEKKLLPFFDFAYQGFGDGLEEDARAVRYFVEQEMECVVCSSYSKSFGLYAERVGALFVICASKKEAGNVGSQVRVLIRGNYSNPPCHGVRIVATILSQDALKLKWIKELEAMRERIKEMRAAFVGSLLSRIEPGKKNYAFMSKQKGMFSYTGLEQDQVDELIANYGIYLPKDGRINVAGLNPVNLNYVADAISTVS